MKGRALVALLCCIFCVSFTVHAAEQPAAEKPMTLMGFDDQTGRDWSQNQFFVRMAEKTGVAFTLQQFTNRADFTTAKDALLGGQQMPDVLFKAGLSPREELRGAQSGALIDLSPLLADNAPHLSALLDAHPEWRKDITLPDGKIVALPAITDPAGQVCIWINKTWLDALQLELPDSPSSFRDMLVAFRDGDPNHNTKNDEVPLYLSGPWEAKWLMSFFGLAANDYNLYADASGTVQIAPFQPQFTEFLVYLHELNAQGLLLDQAFRSAPAMLEQLEREAKTLRVGCMISLQPATLLDPKFSDQFVALPPFAYQGRTAYRDLSGPIWRGTFAITKACPDPVAALRWVDALYAEEGAVLASVGQEGVDYAFDDQGKWNFKVNEMRTLDSLYADSLVDGGSERFPGIRPDAFIAKTTSALQIQMTAQNAKVAHAARMPLPLCYLSDQEQVEIDALQANLGMLVDTAIARFAIDEIPLNDASVATFQQQLRDAGIERLAALWQSAISRRK